MAAAFERVAETLYSRFLLWRSHNTFLKIECPYFGTVEGSRYACTIPNGLRRPSAAFCGP